MFDSGIKVHIGYLRGGVTSCITLWHFLAHILGIRVEWVCGNQILAWWVLYHIVNWYIAKRFCNLYNTCKRHLMIWFITHHWYLAVNRFWIQINNDRHKSSIQLDWVWWQRTINFQLVFQYCIWTLHHKSIQIHLLYQFISVVEQIGLCHTCIYHYKRMMDVVLSVFARFFEGKCFIVVHSSVKLH